jgi:Ca-activated chloride channel homolog
MQFADPTKFWLLLLVPLLAAFLIGAFRARRRALDRFAAPPLGETLAASVNHVARRWKAVFLLGVVLFAVIALAGPRWGWEWRQVKNRGTDIFVLLDLSKSMLTEDVRPNRLTQAKFAVEDLLNKLEGDRVGLIGFAGTAFVECPLTVDYEAFRLTLKEASPAIMPRGGTAIGLAIQTALKSFEASEGRDHVIVLITDGDDTEGDPMGATEEAAKQGVHIYAIGVGTAEGELISVHQSDGSTEFLKNKQGEVVKSRLNEEMLREVALKTHGMYVRSAPGDFGIDAIYERGIAGLHRGEYEARLQKKYFERFQWPLGVAFALLVLESFVSDRRKAA